MISTCIFPSNSALFCEVFLGSLLIKSSGQMEWFYLSHATSDMCSHFLGPPLATQTNNKQRTVLTPPLIISVH